MKRDSNVAMLPMKYPEDDDVQPSLRGKIIEQTMKVRFVAPVFAASELPAFPYVASGVTPHGMIFTAIVMAGDHKSAVHQIEDCFDKVTVQSIEVGSDSFAESDIIPGARVYGVIAPPKKRGWFRK